MEYSGLKIKRPPQAVLRLRRRLNWWCAVDCGAGGRGIAMVTPVPFGTTYGGVPGPLIGSSLSDNPKGRRRKPKPMPLVLISSMIQVIYSYELHHL